MHGWNPGARTWDLTLDKSIVLRGGKDLVLLEFGTKTPVSVPDLVLSQTLFGDCFKESGLEIL